MVKMRVWLFKVTALENEIQAKLKNLRSVLSPKRFSTKRFFNVVKDLGQTIHKASQLNSKSLSGNIEGMLYEFVCSMFDHYDPTNLTKPSELLELINNLAISLKREGVNLEYLLDAHISQSVDKAYSEFISYIKNQLKCLHNGEMNLFSDIQIQEFESIIQELHLAHDQHGLDTGLLIKKLKKSVSPHDRRSSFQNAADS